MEVMKKAHSEKDVVKILNPIVKKWFFSRFKAFSLPQKYGVMEIHKRNNIFVSALGILIIYPTGVVKNLRNIFKLLVIYILI